MKKLLISTYILASLSGALNAKVVFDMGAQQLSNSVEGNFKDSTYDVGDALVSTALAFKDGAYQPKGVADSAGSFKVQVKEPQAKWAVTFAMQCDFGYQGGGCGVSLLGSNGKAISMFFDADTVSVGGKTIKDDGFTKTGDVSSINGSAEMDGDTIRVVINGQYDFNITKPSFKLAHVNLSVFHNAKITDLAVSSGE